MNEKPLHATRKITRLTGRRLIAGASWDNGSYAGSRARYANNYRWNTNSNIGRRFAADPGYRVKLLAGSVGPVSGHAGGKTHNLTTIKKIDRYYTLS